MNLICFGTQTYWNLLEKVPPRELTLSKLDDEIYEHTMREFPEMAEPPYDKVTKLDEEWLKSPDGKERWRNFINSYVHLPVFRPHSSMVESAI
jgi:hypothetical protein